MFLKFNACKLGLHCCGRYFKCSQLCLSAVADKTVAPYALSFDKG
jgi:hypothetical protein